MPYLSVIIPSLNEEVCLPKLLSDLNQQTATDFEVIVVDGKSTDQTPSLVKNHERPYPLTFIQTSKRNVSYQRNLGATKARGQVLVFFDADTQIPKNYLAKIKAAFETKNPHYLTTFIQTHSSKAQDKFYASFINFAFETGRILKFPLVFGAMQAIKKTIFTDIGGYDERTTFAEDSQLFQKAMAFHYKEYLVLKTPRYYFSLRRFHHDGSFETTLQYFKLNLSVLTKGFHGTHPQYTMGGHLYNVNKQPQNLKIFDELLQRVKSAGKQQSVSIKKLFFEIFGE
jgi:glycosyltransferase involved in cell wall biosynthesis